MDIVVVTSRKDIVLLNVLLTSYELYYASKTQLILFVSRADRDLLDQVVLPSTCRVFYKEDFGVLVEDDFLNQMYLKLAAYRLIRSPWYLVLDSDFLFIAPCADEDLFVKGKPFWTWCPWQQEPLRFRSGSEAYLGESIEMQMMEEPPYMLGRDIVEAMDKALNLERILALKGVSEFMAYGWFAWKYYPERYYWWNVQEGSNPVCAKVNQIPPSYCVLDPAVCFADYASYKMVVFWSHWEMAEAKMRQFFHESQMARWGKVRMVPNAILETLCSEVVRRNGIEMLKGVYPDGWFKKEWTFYLTGEDICLQIDVPGYPDGRPTGCSLSIAKSGASAETQFLTPGTHKIALSGASSYTLSFDGGMSSVGDSRTLYARLTAIF